MEQSDFLELNLLSNNDYAGHWDVPLNDSLRMLDAEAEEVATELLDTPGGGYSGQLRGGHASLQERLDTIEDSGLVFNNDANGFSDLEKSRYSRKPWTVPANICDRITKCEESDYVDDSLKASIAASMGAASYIKRRLDRASGLGVKGRRYSGDTSVDLENFYFRGDSAATLITHTGVNEITIGALGLMQIGGNLFHHTRTGTVPVIDAGSHMYVVSASASDATAELDCQLIRSSASAGCSAGVFSEGSSIFTAAGAVNLDDADIGNNHWRPQAGQILRIDFAGAYYDYQIKTVGGGGTGIVEIYGKFEIDSGISSYDWEVYDFTQPCIKVNEIFTADTTHSAAYYSLSKSVAELVLAVVHVEAGNIRVTMPAMASNVTKSFLLQPTFLPTGHIGAGTIEDMEVEGVSASNIKDMKVITIERIRQIGPPDVYHYVTSVNPKRRVTLAGVGDFFLDSFHVVNYGTIESNTGDQIINYGTIGPGVGNTVIRLVHPDYADAPGDTYWSYDPDVVACPQDGYSLLFVGILVELN